MAERVGRVQQVVLLCLLALCVTAMHHVPSAGEPMATVSVSAMDVAGPAPGGHHGPAGGHDVLHLCLAVLTALLLVCVLLLVGRPGRANPARRTWPRGSPAPERPPDRPGRTVLTSLCVLRV
ncbi:hypothetical protein [Amycolatopsis sp. Hca4]|uniref:hypothetical protein n=1 Tax=Amycolatopsis sp. Hca4 TaxID=2742131 RepID=UPI0015927317|nr:hypothetical protein [Amycolatopsis sp. Hca4]QKV78182.1 hypothetical protein HUT10_33675 [Amycolatopsis sp. Hca4]